MLNIIQVYQTNPALESQGGGVRYVRNLFSELAKSEIFVLFLGTGPRVKLNKGKFVSICKWNFSYIIFLICLFMRLPLMNLSNYSVVHIHRAYFAIPFILFKPKLKIICTLHGRTFSVFKQKYGNVIFGIVKPIFNFVESYSLKRIDILVPVSLDVYNHFTYKYNYFSSLNIKIIGSMLDLKQFCIQDSNYFQQKFGNENIYVLFLGRLAPIKDVSFLIKLWSKKFSSAKNIRLVIVGSGENEQEIRCLSSDICKQNPPIFIGEVSSNEVPLIISSSKCVLLSSIHEASPTVVKESLACGIPVVTNDVGDVKKFIVNGENGFIVPKSYDDYENAINYFLKQDLSKEQILKISSNIRDCSVQSITDKYKDIYLKL